MSEPRLEPRGDGVWIPIRLYEAMAHAFYGHGPRHQPLSPPLEATLGERYDLPPDPGVGGDELGQAPANDEVIMPVQPIGLTPISDAAKKTYLPKPEAITDGS